MKLSIIIPVYNAAFYLAQCLASLLDQDLDAALYEIIIVNDGSTDNSESIILKFKEKYTNIIYISQKNQGVAKARNAALHCAKGTYITFVDADDYIDADSLKNSLDKAENENLDLLYLALKTVDVNGNFIENFPSVGKEFETQIGVLHSRRTYPPTLYKKELIDNITFPLLIPVGEDTVFNALVQFNAKRCSYFSPSYYNYRIHDLSAARAQKNDKIFNGFLNAISEISTFKKEQPSLNAVQNNYLDEVVLVFVDRIMQWFILTKFQKKYIEALKKNLQHNELQYLEEAIDARYKFFSSSYRLFTFYHVVRKWYLNLIGK